MNSFKASGHHAPKFWVNAIQQRLEAKVYSSQPGCLSLDNRTSLHFHIMRSTVLIWDTNSPLEPLKDSGVKENETIFSFTSNSIRKLQYTVALLVRPRVVTNFGPRLSRVFRFSRDRFVLPAHLFLNEIWDNSQFNFWQLWVSFVRL